MGHAALDGDAEVGHVGELDGVVGRGEDRLAQVLADLVGVDVEGGAELDVADVVAAEIDVHQAGDELVVRGVAVVLDALHERRGAVADADDGDADLVTRAPAVGGHAKIDAVWAGHPFVPSWLSRVCGGSATGRRRDGVGGCELGGELGDLGGVDTEGVGQAAHRRAVDALGVAALDPRHRPPGDPGPLRQPAVAQTAILTPLSQRPHDNTSCRPKRIPLAQDGCKHGS